MSQKLLLSAEDLRIILFRLACQLKETHGDFSKTVLVGLQPRGVRLAKRLLHILQHHYKVADVKLSQLDITFFRDDFRRSDKVLNANVNNMEVGVENKRIVLIDDVLYTGRSIRAALTAIDSYGRPEEVQLLTLIDRRFSRHLPIQPDFCGRQVDAIQNERVVVCWQEEDNEDAVFLVNK
jgi:pyrimidine operon attenuation protein/uracil phosphoribosyltransferase